MPELSAPSGEQRYGRPPEHAQQGRSDVSSSSAGATSRSSGGSDSSLMLAPVEQATGGDGGYAAMNSEQGAAASGGHFVWRHTGQAMGSASQTLDSSSNQSSKRPPKQEIAQAVALQRAAMEQSQLQEDGPSKSTPEELEALRQAVPKDANGQPTSIGSMKHEDDTCKPCLFFITEVGCGKGVECNFCHFTHNRRARTKPCKGKRDRYKKIVNSIAAGSGTGEPEHGKLETSISKLSL